MGLRQRPWHMVYTADLRDRQLGHLCPSRSEAKVTMPRLQRLFLDPVIWLAIAAASCLMASLLLGIGTIIPEVLKHEPALTLFILGIMFGFLEYMMLEQESKRTIKELKKQVKQ